MNIAIIGYGKMGKMVEQEAGRRGHAICAIIDPRGNGTHKEINQQAVARADVCIDFTEPSSCVENIRALSALGKGIVVGTTGWYGRLAEVEKAVGAAGNGLVYSPNFSLGVNLFLRIVADASKTMGPFDGYDIAGLELHHSGKADSPSGTAKAIASILLRNIPRKKSAVYDLGCRKIEEHELHFASLRTGSIPGTHKIMFDSPADTIELMHTARTREGFAAGAVLASEWVRGKSGVYTMDDMMAEMLR